MTTTLADLPHEILVEIISAVGDVSQLPDLASACRSLASVIYGPGQGLWRNLLCQLYDPPEKAQAFPFPRTSYDYRSQVIERHCVLRFIREQDGLLSTITRVSCEAHAPGRLQQEAEEEPCVQCRASQMMWSRRVLDALLSFYIDLPPNDQPSINKQILCDVLFKPTVAHCIDANVDTDRDGTTETVGDPPVMHFMAVLGHFIFNGRECRWRGRSGSCGFRGYPKGPHGALHRVNHWVCEPDSLNWCRVASEVTGFICATWFQDRYLCDRKFLYGNGYPQASSNIRLPRNTPWDWAGVEDLWEFDARGGYRRVRGPERGPRGRRRMENRRFEDAWHFPKSDCIVPVPSKEAVWKQFEARSSVLLNTALTQDTLWDHFPEMSGDSTRLSERYSPIWFCNDGRGDQRDAFVYGVVCLTRDSPPEMVYTIGWQSLSKAYLGALFQGVHVGGNGCDSGVFGSWGPRAWGPPEHLPSSEIYHQHTPDGYFRSPYSPRVHASPDERFDRFGDMWWHT